VSLTRQPVRDLLLIPPGLCLALSINPFCSLDLSRDQLAGSSQRLRFGFADRSDDASFKLTPDSFNEPMVRTSSGHASAERFYQTLGASLSTTVSATTL
jgi:hypothetical protein